MKNENKRRDKMKNQVIKNQKIKKPKNKRSRSEIYLWVYLFVFETVE